MTFPAYKALNQRLRFALGIKTNPIQILSVMKHILPFVTLLTISIIGACTKDSDPIGGASTQVVATGAPGAAVTVLTSAQARLSSTTYSQSISLDTANKMLGSYLTSVGYPAVDTAIRSLSFDADTLRAYLQNPEIVTLKFMLAHRPEYANSSRAGKFAGMRPDALTLIVVGMDDNQQKVLNSRGGVYDHLSPCPTQCPDGINSPFLF